MELGIAGRTAVVTGSSRGIGAAVAERLRAEGVRVFGVSRSEGTDVRDPDAPALVAARAGRVDILVNNAGTSFVRALDELTDDDWHDQYDLNVTAPRRFMQAFAPGMAERGWGRIVNVASSSGKRPSLTNAAYSVAKAAELSLSRVFAEAYAGSGVVVNAVAPGPVAGPLWLAAGGLADQAAAARETTRESVLEGQAAKVPLGRLLTIDEVAATIAFLCSEAASGVTGAAWSVDGGTVPGII